MEKLRIQLEQSLGTLDTKIDAMMERRTQAIMDRLDGLQQEWTKRRGRTQLSLSLFFYIQHRCRFRRFSFHSIYALLWRLKNNFRDVHMLLIVLLFCGLLLLVASGVDHVN